MAKSLHPATAHVKRLQDDNRRLCEALRLERVYRKKLKAHYDKRLLSRFVWIIDLMQAMQTKEPTRWG